MYKNLIVHDQVLRDVYGCVSGPSSNRTPRKKEIERKQSLDIERWLKNKFREGCHQMQEAFEAKDPTNSGVVCRANI